MPHAIIPHGQLLSSRSRTPRQVLALFKAHVCKRKKHFVLFLLFVAAKAARAMAQQVERWRMLRKQQVRLKVNLAIYSLRAVSFHAVLNKKPQLRLSPVRRLSSPRCVLRPIVEEDDLMGVAPMWRST